MAADVGEHAQHAVGAAKGDDGLARQIEERARDTVLDGCDELLVALRERIRRLERDLDALADTDKDAPRGRPQAARDRR